MNEYQFRELIQKHNALKIRLEKNEIAPPPDRAIWFETKNFGWLYSSIGENGKRQFIAKC